MLEPRTLTLGRDAVEALLQLLGIMTDQVLETEGDWTRWTMDELMAIEVRLHHGEPHVSGDSVTVELGLDDAALLLEGMAFTEMASAHLPWADMVRWTSDFVTGELRPHWSEELWGAYSRR